MEDTLLYTFLSIVIIINILFFFFFFFFFAFIFFLKPRNLYKNLPPGPPSLPIVGHLHLLKHPLHQTFRRLSQKYGPVMSLWFGSRSVVVVSSPSAVKECFTKNDVVLANRPKLLITKHFGYNWTTMATSPYGDHWRNLRRIGSIEVFSASRINTSLSVRKDEIKRLLVKLYRNSAREFKRVEMKSLLTQLGFNIMMRMISGKQYYGDDVSDEVEPKKFRELLQEMNEASRSSNAADFLPLLKWFSSLERKLKGQAMRFDKFLQGLINEHRLKKESTNTMIDHLLSLQQSRPKYYTDHIIKGLIQVILLGGIDTTSVTLEWAFSNLLNYPDTLATAKNEIDDQIGQQRLVDGPDISKLPYLQSIISETLRLNPPAPLLLPHYSSADCKIGGYDVPKDTMIFANAWAIQRDPQLWEDPEVFKPERFDVDNHEDHMMFPFGIGRRVCPGSGLAKQVLGLALGSLIQCFEWKKVNEEGIDMREGEGIIAFKLNPLEVMCKARSIMNNILLESMEKI